MSDEIIYSNIQTKGPTLLSCGGGTCNEVPENLCTLNPTNTCWKYDTSGDDVGNTGIACPEVDSWVVGADFDYTAVIVCCSGIGVIFGFSLSGLSENGVSQYNGTGYGDCRELMSLFSPDREGDYCDRLNVSYTFPPSCP
jgi:hypothetical protein